MHNYFHWVYKWTQNGKHGQKEGQGWQQSDTLVALGIIFSSTAKATNGTNDLCYLHAHAIAV
jgi:hypothetical protein